jgi:hypothetical protein
MKCANHPLIDSVAYCGQCGRPLCDDCKRDVRGMTYCEVCLATRLQTPLPLILGARRRSESRRGLGLGLHPGSWGHL